MNLESIPQIHFLFLSSSSFIGPLIIVFKSALLSSVSFWRVIVGGQLLLTTIFDTHKMRVCEQGIVITRQNYEEPKTKEKIISFISIDTTGWQGDERLESSRRTSLRTQTVAVEGGMVLLSSQPK